MKKIISLLMVLCLMASLCSMSAFAEDGGETAPPLPNAKVEFTSGADYAPLTYALRFAVDFDTLTQAQRDYYGDWPTDFVLTSNKNANLCAGNINEILANEYVFTAEGYDGYIAGSYPSFGGGLWVPVPFLGTSEGLDGVPAITFNDQPLTLRANNGVDVMGYLLEATGFDEIFDMDFDFVVNMVKEFSCGIYFTDEFLLNNPGTNVVVQLIMTNPETGERHIIGKELYYNTPGSSKEQPLKLEESVVVSEPIVVSGDTYIELQNNTLKNAFSLAPGADSLCGERGGMDRQQDRQRNGGGDPAAGGRTVSLHDPCQL